MPLKVYNLLYVYNVVHCNVHDIVYIRKEAGMIGTFKCTIIKCFIWNVIIMFFINSKYLLWIM